MGWEAKAEGLAVVEEREAAEGVEGVEAVRAEEGRGWDRAGAEEGAWADMAGSAEAVEEVREAWVAAGAMEAEPGSPQAEPHLEPPCWCKLCQHFRPRTTAELLTRSLGCTRRSRCTAS